MSNQNAGAPLESAAPVSEVKASVRLIKPKKNLVAFANINIGGHFAVNDIPVKTGKNGIFFDNPTKQDNRGKYIDVCLPTSAEMRQAITAAITEAYGLKIEKHQAIGDAQREATQRPSIKDSLRDGAKAAAAQPPAIPKDAPSRAEPSI